MGNKEYLEILVTYLLRNISDNISPIMTIKKYSSSGYIKKISPEVKNKEYDITALLSYDTYNAVIERFLKTCQEKLPHCNLSNLYDKLTSLKIREHRSKFLKSQDKKESGNYYPKKNKLNVYPKNFPISDISSKKYKEDVITHELLHTASTYKKGIIILSGFSQNIGGKLHVGLGLNEGYTEFLNLRYFTHEKPTKPYMEQQFLARGIEQIVSQKKMEELYFNADLDGLVTELSKYAPKDEIASLLKAIDDCHKQEGIDEQKYKENAAKARVMIANIQIKKAKILYAIGEITEEEHNFKRLRSYYYLKGYILKKNKQDYIVSNHNEPIHKIIPSDGYRIILNNFLKNEVSTRKLTFEDAANVDGDLVDMGYCLNHIAFKEQRDLSEVEDIKMLSSTYILFLKQSKESTSLEEQDITAPELNSNVNPINTSSTNSKELDEMFTDTNLKSSPTTENQFK